MTTLRLLPEGKNLQIFKFIAKRACLLSSRYNTEEKKLALQDVTILLSFLYSNTSSIPMVSGIDQILVTIVLDGNINSILQNLGQSPPLANPDKIKDSSDENKSQKSACCQIF